MKISVIHDEVTHDGLNSALNDYSKLLNQHLVASGNSIELKDETEAYDQYDTLKNKQRYKWIVKATIEWKRVPIQ